MASGLFVALHSNFRLYELWPVTDGQLHTAAVVAVYGWVETLCAATGAT